jgi:hypothetical protein
VCPHPPPRPTKGDFVSEERIARFTLKRVHPDGTEEVVSDHETRLEGVEAGMEAMGDRKAAFSLYDGGRLVHKFGHSTLTRKADPAALAMFGGLL